jgi:hypothetical protein
MNCHCIIPEDLIMAVYPFIWCEGNAAIYFKKLELWPYNNYICCTTVKNQVRLQFNGGFLGCDAVWTCRWVSMFGRNILPPSSGMK